MSHVRVGVALDRDALVPGDAATLAVRFVIEEGWHLYWRNSGDSGLPIALAFTAPEGVRIGEVRWPAPERHVYGHESVDYIYEHEVALLAPIEVDEGFQPGDAIEIGVGFDLLACERGCVFGSGSRSIVIDIAESASMSSPAWLEKNRARVPMDSHGLLDVRWDGSDLLISGYDREKPIRMSFFPLEPVDVRPVDPARDGISETGLIRFAYPRDILGEPRVAGIVEIVGPDGPVWIEIDTAPPGAPQSGGEANEPTPTPTPQTINPSETNRSGD